MRRVDGSDFKKKLLSMPFSTTMRVQGPLGDFVLPKKFDQPITMLAGGIGITPFLSMISWATEEKLPHRIMLFFANSSPRRATFLEELETLQAQNNNFKFIPVFERIQKSLLNPQPNTRYYLAGSPGFVTEMRHILDEAGVDEDNIRTEEFSGY